MLLHESVGIVYTRVVFQCSTGKMQIRKKYNRYLKDDGAKCLAEEQIDSNLLNCKTDCVGALSLLTKTTHTTEHII